MAYPELQYISKSRIQKFYFNEMRISYKRITLTKSDKNLNYKALCKFTLYLKELYQKGFTLCSLDECPFNLTNYQKYGYSLKGEPV